MSTASSPISLSTTSESDNDSDYEESLEMLSVESERAEGSYILQTAEESSNKECSNKSNVDEVLYSDSVKMIDKNCTDKSNVDEVLYSEAVQMIDGRDMKNLKLDHCKAYLRAHGLRLAGSKATLLGRIQDYVELKAIGGQAKYPRPSFVIYCKGDVCCGDVVLFRQKVYEKFSIVTRSAEGPPLGERVIAGRVVKESYGIKKQQHTFTIEVLWSFGFRPLPPMAQLMVKGRNLYRHSIFRQRWINEDDRKRAIHEKHARGDMARRTRAVAKESRYGHSRLSEKIQKSIPQKNPLKANQQREAPRKKPCHHSKSSCHAEGGNIIVNTQNKGKRMSRNMEISRQRQAKKMRVFDNGFRTDNNSGLKHSYAGQSLLVQKSTHKSEQVQPINKTMSSLVNIKKVAEKRMESKVGSLQVICSSSFCQNFAPQNCVKKMCKPCCKNCGSSCARHR